MDKGIVRWLAYGHNSFPDGKVPEIILKLQVIRFYRGAVTLEQLSDPATFEAAHSFMLASAEAEKIQAAREQAREKYLHD